MMLRHHHLFLLAIALLVCGARATHAQGTLRRVVFRVQVTDSGSAPLAEVNVAVGRLGLALAGGTTGESGQVRLVVTSREPSVEITARRVGYAPARRTLRLTTDSLDLHFTLARVAVALDTVRASSRMLSDNYVLGAAEIARSDRTIRDAYDAIRDLRPQLLGDRMRDCPYVQDLWINGVRQPVFPSEIVPMSETPMMARDDGSGRPAVRPHFPLSHAPTGFPLASIAPAHIAEIRYVGCHQRPAAGMHSVNALFISLKAGIGFDLKRGSYVVDSALARDAGAIP